MFHAWLDTANSLEIDLYNPIIFQNKTRLNAQINALLNDKKQENLLYLVRVKLQVYWTHTNVFTLFQ